MAGFAGCSSQVQVAKSNKPVYMIAEVQVLDAKVYSEYAAKAKGIVEKYNGCYVVRGGKVTPLEGTGIRSVLL